MAGPIASRDDPHDRRRREPIRQEDRTAYDVPGDLSFRVELLVTPEETAAATRDANVVDEFLSYNLLTAAHIAAFGPKGLPLGRPHGKRARRHRPRCAARPRGLTVYHVPDYCTAEVATQAMALILAVQRRILEGDRTSAPFSTTGGR